MKSKIELLQFAVNTALNAEGVNTENFFEFAKKVEEYVIGEAELPEVYDETEHLQKMTEIITKNTPTPAPFAPVIEPFNPIENEETDKEATPAAEAGSDAEADAE